MSDFGEQIDSSRDSLPAKVKPKLFESSSDVPKKAPSSPKPEEKKYSPEETRKQIEQQAKLISAWADKMGFKEPKDYRIIKDTAKAIKPGDTLAEHEKQQFAMIIHKDHYEKFKQYFTTEYRDEMKKIDPKNDAKLLYSWGGRFLVGWAGVPFDTAPAIDVEHITVETHHSEFKDFFREKTGGRREIPPVDQLNDVLRGIAERSLQAYVKARDKLQSLKDEDNRLPEGKKRYPNLYEVGGMDWEVDLLEAALKGKGVEELPQIIREDMPRPQRTYADITYNIKDVGSIDRALEITGVKIPESDRIDKIYEQHFHFGKGEMAKLMKEACADFPDHLEANKELKTSL